jgi:hypothetical protein
MVLREWGFHVVQIVFKYKKIILCTYLGELPHFILKHHLAIIIVFDVTLYHFVLNNIEVVMIPCLCTLYFNSNRISCAQTLGSFFILFRALFWSYHNIIIWLFLDHLFALFFFLEDYPLCYFVCNLLILNIVLFPPTFCLWICGCVLTHFFWNMHTLRRNSHYIGLLSLSAHFVNGCQWGRSFEGLKGSGLQALVLFLSILGWVYIVETPPITLVGNICNEIQVHSHVHRLWGSLLYIWWLY